MLLYGTPPTRAARVLWVLRHLQVDCEVVFVSLLRGDHRKPEFLALNPAGRIPVLVDGDWVLTESVAIALYLAERHPQGQLLPCRLEERAQMMRWLLFVVTEIEALLERIERHTALYPESERLPQEVEKLRQECGHSLGILDLHLLGRAYLATERLSLADLLVAYTLEWADECKLLDSFPGLYGYKERIYQLPSAPPRTAQALRLLQSGQPIDWFSV